MKKILGLDLGTSSIGWAVIENNVEGQASKIIATGSRIIPMDAAILGDFNSGNTVSQTAARTGFRGTRRLLERNLLRRERLLRVLNVMGFLPPHYADKLDRFGHITDDSEPKLAWLHTPECGYKFIFKDSFEEMMSDFRKCQPQLFRSSSMDKDAKIPYDWTLYYLRKKALTQPVSNQELAWILLSFNKKRGYYQLRGEDEEAKSDKLVEFYALRVVDVDDTGEKKGNYSWYNVHLENGWIYRRPSSVPLDWIGKTKEFIVTTTLDDDGNPKIDKDGAVKRSFRAPKDDDWTLLKKKTERDIELTNKTVGQYIYDSLLQNPDQKINGKLIRTIERKFYKDELVSILQAQSQFNPILRDRNLYENCICALYESNDAYRKSIAEKNFVYLFVDDIIFYQRQLKRKKSLIEDCPYEVRFDKNGQEYPIKCIAQSHPLFQEFRLWQFLQNLRIYARVREVDGNLLTDVDVTNEFLKTEDDYVSLFDWLNDRGEIEQNTLFGSYFHLKKPKGKDSQYSYRWNYVEDKSYPCNETRWHMLTRFSKVGIPNEALTSQRQEALWHILYSVSDRAELVKALHSFAQAQTHNGDFDAAEWNNNREEAFVEVFRKCPPYTSAYGAYSAKATKRLLALMRMGKYWSEDAVDEATRTRINKIIAGEYDPTIRERVRQKAYHLSEVSLFRGLPLWLSCYVVYDRHSEMKQTDRWREPSDIDAYLKNFKQHSLRNPIVEQVVTETLRTVRDIWTTFGQLDEIHVELGREMKNTAQERARITTNLLANERSNMRVKAMLAEFVKPEYKIKDVRPYSPSQQESLRIYEDYALQNIDKNDSEYDFVTKILQQPQPSASDILRYKLWLEQKYCSPYTGEIIPLSELFTSAYEIEHIIPQSRYFDDSFTNKVICESAVNKLKDNSLGREFICGHQGEKVQLNFGRTVEIFTIEAYDKFVKEHYSNSSKKMRKLLLNEIPDDFIARQMNDSRYISRLVTGLLSNIVREDDEQESVSKHLIVCTGSITDCLKKDWGVNDVWNGIILPRFKRMNMLLPNECFTVKSSNGHEIPSMPLARQKGFNKKRIDHRHHAMDAIVIACATRNHVNLLNNEAAKSSNRANRYQLSRLLRNYEKREIVKDGERRTIDVACEFKLPWSTFPIDVKNALQDIVVSFKQNLRVINKTVNKYQHFENGKKVLEQQIKGDRWAIRKPMHKDTFFGEVNLRQNKTVTLNEAIKNPKAIVDRELKSKIIELLRSGADAKMIKKYFTDNKDAWQEVNLAKINVYYFTNETSDRYFATRKNICDIFTDDKGKIKDLDKCKKSIEAISDTGIQKILYRHLTNSGDNPELAFSVDGIDKMNKNIINLNGGKLHKPILNARWCEKADKFAVGTTGNKSTKFVEAAKGTNIFFAIYGAHKVDEDSGIEKIVRSYETIPLNLAIARQKQGQPVAPEINAKGNVLQFVLTPGDLVYVPTVDQLGRKLNVSDINKNRIYKLVSFAGAQCFFISERVAVSVVDKVEFSSLNKMERAITGEMIKEICIPIKVNRIGEINIE